MPTIVCDGKTVELVRVSIAEPTICPVCNSTTGRRLVGKKKETGSITECKNASCPAKADARLKTWIKKLDIQGIGDELLYALISDGLAKTPADFYRLDVAQICDLTVGKGRLGEKRAIEIIKNIQNTRTLPINLFMGSLGIPHLGRRRVQLIIEACPGKFDTLDDWLGLDKLRSLADKAGVPNIVTDINKGIMAFSDEIADLRQYVTVIPMETKMKPASTGDKLAGRIFCFTGKIEKCDASGTRYTRDRMQQLVIDNGGSISDDVRSNTTDLVQADINSTSSKSTKAKRLGVNLMAEADFFALVEE